MGVPLLLVQRRPAGEITLIGPDGREETRDTVQCVHCGAHWVPEPGSGKRRGWCFRDPGPLCGSWACYQRCQSQEALVERIEAAASMALSMAILRGEM